jgi:hypothetical protein
MAKVQAGGLRASPAARRVPSLLAASVQAIEREAVHRARATRWQFVGGRGNQRTDSDQHLVRLMRTSQRRRERHTPHGSDRQKVRTSCLLCRRRGALGGADHRVVNNRVRWPAVDVALHLKRCIAHELEAEVRIQALQSLAATFEIGNPAASATRKTARISRPPCP